MFARGVFEPSFPFDIIVLSLLLLSSLGLPATLSSDEILLVFSGGIILSLSFNSSISYTDCLIKSSKSILSISVKYLTESELETIESYLEELYPEGMTDTELNDFMWFEDDTIAEWLGYNSFDEIMNRSEEE